MCDFRHIPIADKASWRRDQLPQPSSPQRTGRRIRRFDHCQAMLQRMFRVHQTHAPVVLSSTANPLRRLVTLRRIEVLTQAVVLVLALAWLKIPLDGVPMIAAIAVLAAVNFVTQWWIDKGGSPTANEVFAHMAIDVAILAVLLYFAGGPANPFVSLFLLPPTLAAAMLPARHAWAMAGLTLFAYTFLMFWNLPLPPPQGDLAQFDALLARATGGTHTHAAHGSGFALHVLGMWLNFVISLGVVAFFLTRMAATLKNRERELAAAREAGTAQRTDSLARNARRRRGAPVGHAAGDDGRGDSRTRTATRR
jgi:hypothetical protein